MTWFLSITSVLVIYLVGTKWKYTPLVGLFGQVFWIIWSITSRNYGLILGTVAYAVVHGWNAHKWLKKPQQESR